MRTMHALWPPTPGLASMRGSYDDQLHSADVFALIVVLAAGGALLYFLVEWLDKRLIDWRDQQLG